MVLLQVELVGCLLRFSAYAWQSMVKKAFVQLFLMCRLYSFLVWETLLMVTHTLVGYLEYYNMLFLGLSLKHLETEIGPGYSGLLWVHYGVPIWHLHFANFIGFLTPSGYYLRWPLSLLTLFVAQAQVISNYPMRTMLQISASKILILLIILLSLELDTFIG